MTNAPAPSSPGWNPATRDWLSACIQKGAGQAWPVVFDFDNTLIYGDIGEATLAMLVRDREITEGNLPETLRLSFLLPKGSQDSMSTAVDLTEYYEGLLQLASDDINDPAPMATGYAWAVEIMQGLTVSKVVGATQKVWALSRPGQSQRLEVTPGHTSYPVPFFYPAMVDLLAELLRADYVVRIVSASNVWSVRWLVLNGLNPLLRERGALSGVLPQHVLGVSNLMFDPNGRLYKDPVLVNSEPAYARMDPDALGGLRLTPWLSYPVPIYSGKVGAIWDACGRRPYLGVGDSPGDHPMLTFSENRLWIARLEKPDYQEAAGRLIRQSTDRSWAIQPVLSRPIPGFISDTNELPQVFAPLPQTVTASLAILARVNGINS